MEVEARPCQHLLREYRFPHRKRAWGTAYTGSAFTDTDGPFGHSAALMGNY